MVRPGRDALRGRVEIDETCVGGLAEGKRGRGSPKKALVVIAAEEDGAGIGRIRMARIADASACALEGFVVQTVAAGSGVHTDGWDGYNGLSARGYQHEASVLRGQGKEAATQLMPQRASCRGAAEALAAGHASGCRARGTPGLLPRRIHVSI